MIRPPAKHPQGEVNEAPIGGFHVAERDQNLESTHIGVRYDLWLRNRTGEGEEGAACSSLRATYLKSLAVPVSHAGIVGTDIFE